MRRLSGMVAAAATTALIAAPLAIGTSGASADGLDDLTITGIDDAGTLLTYTEGDLRASVIGPVGIRDGETLEGIDYRPATGDLYGLVVDDEADRGRVVRIDDTTGAVTGSQRLWNFINTNIRIADESYDIDFNPTVDRLRVVGSSGQNLRINVDTGLTLVDGRVGYPGGGASSVTGVAYNNNRAGATTTKLFDLESVNDQLALQDPPNEGTLVNRGEVAIDVDADTGFDIYSPNAKQGGRLVVSTPGFLGTTIANLSPKTGELRNTRSINGTTFVDIAIPIDD